MRDGAIDRGTGLAHLRRYTWVAVPGSIAALLLLFIGELVLARPLPAWGRAVCAAALAVTVVASVVLLSRRMVLLPGDDVPRPTGWLVAGGAGAAVLGTVALAFHEYGLWAVAPAVLVAITMSFLPAGGRWVLLAGAVVLAPLPGAVVSLASGDDNLLYAAAFPLGLVVFTIWVTLGPLWAFDLARRLHRARALAAELAVTDERLRFAADLHDIQGHHLQVIALKSELAERLAATDPDRAAAEMAEVRRLATAALRDTRAVVQGYRRTTLADEITNATRVLAAADIDARMTVEPATDALAPTGRHLLGLVMREATTNVIRHSRASRAEVDYRVDAGRAWLRVSNDGAPDGLAETSGSGPAGTPGSGLASLAARLAAAGGELTWRQHAERFEIAACLPVGAPSGSLSPSERGAG